MSCRGVRRKEEIMSITPFRAALLATASLMVLPPAVGTVRADAASALRCRQTINKELGKFVKTKSTILRKCKESAVKRGVPATPVECPLTPQDDKINAAAQKMKDKIAGACGGANKACNAADVGADADEPLADVGWDIGACPDLSGHGCTNTIADCNDIGTCLACIGHSAVDRANELYYDLLVASEFTTGSPVNKCQIAIGLETTKFLQTKSNLLRLCWSRVLAGSPGYTSPPGCPHTDAKTVAKLAQAEQKKIAAICKACGADGDADADGLCDVPAGGFSPTAIGFEPNCPDMTVPGSPTSCVATVNDLGALIACVDCATEFFVDCATALAVPSAAAYPAECTAVP
jgi:hypothetical protein